ncbi:aspartate/glutamate racemase family protein [Limoniibacter endophyticus]|uniref:Asp/Glu/hydantoin racemase n=1 Tax=Limoniibacter endophyticus TaxID=1565040 RepID=A0A8J3DG29_9HYPH|nr:aspartate/glutamate racemase family protein [Limoniibacter endophyticus]GHC66336.1 Asp/Glu/hydantoin racemase [Limoniibacter endophyticus]
MARILVIVPFALDAEGVANRQAQQKYVSLDDGTELTYRPVSCGPTSFMSPHDWTLMEMAIFEAGLSAEQDGFDAVCIDTMSDSGLHPLRSILNIPVVSPGKASMLYALTLGSSFSVLAQWEPALPRYRKAIREYGFEKQCASVRSFDQPPDFSALLDGKEETVFPRMRDVAMRCIEEDGAEVICLGSTTMHQAANYLAEHLPVPVINPGPLTYKLAETFLALGLKQGRAAYPSPVVSKINELRLMMQAGAAAENKAAN